MGCLGLPQLDENESVSIGQSSATLLDEDPLIGMVLSNQYRIEESIGSGGWATVYRATQLSLGDNVAVKVLHSGLADKEAALKRIEQEAKVLSRIDSQYIVKTVDYGVTSSYPYFVMEYFDGTPLSKYLKTNGRFAIADGIEIMQQLCDGLADAHRLGLIHRDMKPDNVLLRTNPELRAKIIDFGIAKLFDESSENLTKSSEVLGSPPYMAPEQWTKNQLDIRVDIYALGCIAYEIFSNTQVFVAEHTYEYLRLHASEDPKPFAGSLKIPKDLQRIILKCLQKDPADRYQNTTEINSDLAKLKSGRKLKIVLRRSKNQRLKDLVLIGGSVVAVTSLAAVALWMNRESILLPYCEEENRRGDRFLQAAAPLKAIPHYRNVIFWSEYLDKQDRRRLHALRMLAKTLRSNGSFAEATELENKVYLAVGASVNPANRLKLEEALGVSQNSLEELQRARNLAKEQMQRAESTIGKHTMSYADGLMALSMLADPADAKSAIAQMKESISIATDLMEPNDWTLGVRYIYLGQLLVNINQPVEAKAALSQGLSIAMKAKNDLEICNANVTLACVELKLHNPKKAMELLQFADAYYRKTVGGDHPQIWYISAQAFHAMNDRENYLRTLHKTLKVADEKEHALTKINVCRDLGVAYFKSGEYELARKYCDLTKQYSQEYGQDTSAVEAARFILKQIDGAQKK